MLKKQKIFAHIKKNIYLCTVNKKNKINNMKKIVKFILKWIIYTAVFPHNFIKGFIYGWNLEKNKSIVNC